jgi:4,5-DOPA dioxygenase extradiol
MNGYRYPSLFISHGSPMLAFGEDAFSEMLEKFSTSLPKPKALVFISAHSVSSDTVHVLKCDQNEIIHDFNGFPKELYEIGYDCKGSPDLADQIVQLLKKQNFQTKVETRSPLDHGIWVPLKHLYPKGDVPVVKVSLPLNLTPAMILKLGHALAPLRNEGVMLIGTGGAVHNLRELRWSQKTFGGADWALNFENWIIQCLEKKNVDALVNAEEHPEFFQSHPSEEHYLPLLATVGAALPGDEPTILHRGIEYYSLSMLTFALNKKDAHDQTQSLH